MQQKLERYPFCLISSQGLGVSYSSLDKIGSLIPVEGFGGAGIKFYPNIYTGNLVVKDHVLNIKENPGPIELYYTYNSQAIDVSNLWQFSHKKFRTISQSSPIAVLQESDGHQTIYAIDKNTGYYFSPACSSQGTPWLKFDDQKQLWIWYHPGKNITEYYDTEGYLLKLSDMQGRFINYEYDSKHNLSAIVGQSGSRYEIRRSDKTVGIYFTGKNLEDQLLQQYQFDDLGRLACSQTADGYQILYNYGSSQDSWKLVNIQQSDQSLLNFNYNQNKKLSGFKLGEETVYNINYPDSIHPKASITDGFNGITQIGLDSQANITDVSRSQGFDSIGKQTDTTAYSYFSSGQLESITKPNKSQEKFTYQDIFGLIQTHTQPNGQITEEVYQQDSDQIRLIGEIQYDDNQLLITRYTYDANYNNNNYIFQRFKISPSGWVTEYRPDKNGNIASKREYLSGKIDLSKRDSHTSPSLAEMLDWVSTQDPQQVNLTEYGYNDRGQLVRTRQYANIDAQGNGIIDHQMGEEIIYPNLYGNWFTRQVKKDDKNSAVTKRTYDGLQRLTSETDALNNTISYQYLDDQNQVKIIYPNGKIELIQKDDRTKIIQKREIVELNNSQTRTTQYGRDTQGRVVLTTRPDGQWIYSFYDHQDRLGFTVTTSGIVTEYQYDLENRCNTQIQYANPIDPKQLFLVYPPLARFLPVASKLIALLKNIENPSKDRVSYKIFDESGRLAYSVDADKIITQYFYNKRNLKITDITYETSLTDDQIQKLISGQEIKLNPDFNSDRSTRYFYDNDNYLIAKQDSAGYIAEYVRDNAGKVKEKNLYANKVSIDLNINNFNLLKINLVLSDKDAHSYYFRNKRGKIRGELNPGDNPNEYYYTEHQYYANGLKQKSIKYDTKVTEISAIPPVSNPAKDQVTNYQYDLLNRPVNIEFPNQKIKLSQYDVMSNIIFNQTRDAKDIHNDDPDHQRGTTAHYDNWNQKNHETNVFGGEITHAHDITGLKIHTKDALDNIIYYFYDIDRRPVASVGPTGIITENILDSFGDIIETRKYSNKITKDKIPEGGYLTDEIRKLFIQNPDQDQVILLERNKSGLVTKKTDANKNIFNYQYNAYKECVTEIIPVESNIPTLTKTHKFDNRGLEISTISSAVGIEPEIIVREYDNLYGKETSRLDARNGFYRTDYSIRGKIKEKSKFDGAVVAKHEFSYTAFEELDSESDSLGNITSHSYDQTKRTHIINYPVQGVTEITTQNIFSETIQHQDSLGNTQNWTHAPNAKIATYTDQLGNKTSNKYDLMGQLSTKTDANNTETDFKYDNAGYLILQIDDALGQKFQTSSERDSFGNATTITDPRNIITKNTFDQCNNNIESILDTQLNITTQKTYNAQGKLTSQIQGDKDNPHQYQEIYQIDSRNRNMGKIIDPDGLKLITQQNLNTSGDVISEIDANGNITRKFYNTLGKLRFTVDPEGGVSETNYDTEDRISYTRVYENSIDPAMLSDKTELKELLNLIKINPQDTLLYHFYDSDGKERFQVNSRGAVAERQYNLARREIKNIIYNTKIDPKLLSTLTTGQLIDLVKFRPEDNKDRINYKIRDNKQQERFVIDGEKYISEKRYDNNGNVIARIKYALRLTDPQQIANLPSEQVLNNIIIDAINDRATYQIFDSRNKPQYVVDGEGNVTQFWHDENENLIQTSLYKNPIKVPSNYDDLKNLLKTLIPNPQIDSMTKSGFDNANRKISETDPLGYIDKFKKDALGNTTVHTDRAKNNWLYRYDTANRLETETRPPVSISVVQQTHNPNGSIVLSSTQTTLAIQDKKNYDNNGNELQLIKAANSPQARNLTCTYNKNNQIIQTKISNININDESKPASFDNPPVKTVDIKTQMRYNAKKLKICEQNEAGAWSFYVYNSEGKPVYEINVLGVVTQFMRNTFGEIISDIIYANKINLDLTKYIQSGIPLNIIEQAGVIIPDKTKDRTKTYDRDNRGDVITTKMGPVMYYLPNGTDHPVYNMDYAEITQQYNAFRECSCKKILSDPNNYIYTQQLYWFNRNGKIIAECDPVYRVIRRAYDSAGHEIGHSEWAEPPKVLPAPTTTLIELDSNYVSSPKDRNYEYRYNLAGLCTQKMIKNAVTQQVILGNNNIPSMKNLSPQDLSQIYEYNAIQKRISVTYEDGSLAYSYYDALGLQIAAIDVSRQNSSGKNLIPLSYFGNDVFGNRVTTTKFKQGTSSASSNQLPIPIALDPDDQTDLKLFDKRGLPSFTQNAEGIVTAFTYNESRKSARQFYYVTNRDARHIDENSFEYDLLDHPVKMSVLRDNTVIQTTASQYNSFGNCISEGPGDNTWPLYRRYDQMNNCWADNADGVSKINLYNLSSKKTLEAKSATQDLSLVSYDQLENILALDPVDLERTETQYDNAGRKSASYQPVYSQFDPNDPKNSPIHIIAGDNYTSFGRISLTWLNPQQQNYHIKMRLWRSAAPDRKEEVVINQDGYRYGVNVSEFDTDVYTYEMDYYFNNPVDGSDSSPRYRTTGQVQFDTGKNYNSLMIVTTVLNGSTLILSGNTKGLTAVELWQGDIKLAQIPVQYQNYVYSVDLSQYPSGIYTIVPIVPGKENLPGSLRFTLHTYTPAGEPISQQIDSLIGNLYIWNYRDDAANIHLAMGRFDWIVPKQYAKFPVNLTCHYKDRQGNLCTQQDVISPGELKYQGDDMAHAVEKSYKINTYFPVTPDGFNDLVTIEDITVSLKLNSTEAVVIAKAVQPSIVTGDGAHILTAYFPNQSILYISPLKNFKTLPIIEYLDVTMDRRAVWKSLPAIGLSNQGIMIDITGMEPCIYPFRIKGQLTFWENCKKIIRKLNATRVDQTGKTLIFEFQEVIPNRESGYGFQLIGSDREAVTEFLSHQKNNDYSRQTLAPVIAKALMDGAFKIPDIQWEMLKEKYEKEDKNYKNMLSILQQRKYSQNIDYDKNNVKREQEKLEGIQTKIIEYCSTPEVYESYVNHLKNNGDMDYQSALLYAKQNGFSLFVWENYPENIHEMRSVAFYEAGDSSSKIFHLSLSGSTSFNVLLPKGLSIEDLYGIQHHYTFTVEPPSGCGYPSDDFPPAFPLDIRPGYNYTYDAWNNLTKVVDTLGNETNYEYGYNSQRLTQTQPEVHFAKPDNSIDVGRPVTQFGYNTRGHKIGMTDPNGNTQAYILDNSGQETGMVLGDGLLVRQQNFDALGMRESHTDARKYTWQYCYNHINKITKITYPSGLSTSYIYNELYRVKDIDQSTPPLITSYDYDALGNISHRVTPTGLTTLQIFDRNHLMIYTANPDNTSMSWKRDYFGKELQHIDLCGVQYSNWCDYKGQVIRRFSTAERMNYKSNLSGYGVEIRNIPAQDIIFEYKAGRLMYVIDSACLDLTEYDYDSENREIFVQSNSCESVTTILDAMGREESSCDSGSTVSTIYDLNNNRRRVFFSYVYMQTVWYNYDAANRVIVDGGTGLTLTYEDGFRVKETNSAGLYRTLTYTIDGILSDTNYYQINKGSVITAHRGYTPNGYLYDYTEAENGSVYYKHGITLNQEGWQTIDWQAMNGKLVCQTNYSNFTNTGLALYQYSQYANNIQDKMTNQFTYYDEPKLTSVSGTRIDQYGTGSCSTATRYFDPNGTITAEEGLQDETDPNNPTTISKFFQASYDGRIISRTICGVYTMLQGMKEPDFFYSRYFYNAMGEMISSYETDPMNPDDYSITLNYMQHVLDRFQSSLQGLKTNSSGSFSDKLWNSVKFSFEKSALLRVISSEENQIAAFKAQAHSPHISLPDFIRTYPAPTPEKYTVASDDNCTKIAQRMYGDANFASSIAQLNGLLADETLYVGQILKLPQYLPSSNNASNATPYDRFMSIMIGGLYPHLDLKQPPPPKPRHHHHSGGWLSDVVHAVADIVGAVVGVAIAVVAPELLPLFVAAMTTLADAAYQEVAVAVGWQDHFSLTSAVVAGVEAGITAGIMSGGATTFSGVLKNAAAMSIKDAAIAAGEIAVADQLVEMAAGLRTKFDFTQILIQVGSSLIMSRVAPIEDKVLGKTPNLLAANAINDEAQGLLGGELEHVIEGQKVDIVSISVQSLGAAVSQTFSMNIEQNESNKEIQAAYQQAQQDSAESDTSAANSNSNTQAQSNQNPGRNRNGFFSSNSNLEKNQTSYQQKSNIDKTNWLTVDPNDTDKLFSGSSGLLDNAEAINETSVFSAYIKDLEDPVSWIESTIDKTGEYLEKNKLPVFNTRYKNYWNQAVSFSNEAKSVAWDDPAKAYKLNFIANQSYNIAARNGFFADSIDVVDFARKSFTGLDIATGVYDVIEAQPKDRFEVGLEQTGRILGGMLGGFVGGVISTPTELLSPFVGIPLQVGTAVAFSTAGSDIAEAAADDLYQWAKPNIGGI